MRDVAIIGFAQTASVRREPTRDEAELVRDATEKALADAGVAMSDVGFTCSGSSDLLCGRPFSFVAALDGIVAWPPISESHVEMDGAWALYEGWARLQHGDIDVALVYGFGKSSPGPVREVMALQLDPYTLGPLGLDSVSVAALQARVMIDRGLTTEREMAEVAARSRRSAGSNPNAQLRSSEDAESLLAAPYLVSPLRRHDCPPVSDAAGAIVLAAGDRARAAGAAAAWITAIDHRVDPHELGRRDLASAPSARAAGERCRASDPAVDVAELHAPFSHQEVLLRRELGLADGVRINPSGGALAANPIMVAGLLRIGEAAGAIRRGEARVAIAHATSGPALQQNLVCRLESRS
ncbi:MAG: lipid-transfer protein [Myxococcales bacterium]|nr:lipid-transfer protein [Myxococcales bacterium]